MTLIKSSCPITDLQILQNYTIPSHYLVLQGTLNTTTIYLHNLYTPSWKSTFFRRLPIQFSTAANHIVGGDLNISLNPKLDSLPIAAPNGTGRQIITNWINTLGLDDLWRRIHPHDIISSGPRLKHRLDYCFISPRLIEQGTPSSDFLPLPTLTDHFGLLSHIHNGIPQQPSNIQNIPPWIFQLPATKIAISRLLQKRHLNPSQDIFQFYERLKKQIHKELLFIKNKHSTNYQLENRKLTGKYIRAKLKEGSSPSPTHTLQCQLLLRKLTHLHNNRRALLRGKRTYNAIKFHDKSSRQFFKRAKPTTNRTYITKVQKPDGTISEDPQTIFTEFTNSWISVFNSTHLDSPIDTTAQSDLLQSINTTLSDEDKKLLDEPISILELEQAIKSLSKHKTPGPDGLPAEMYLLNTTEWATLLHELFQSAIHDKGHLPNSHRQTLISLLYKKDCPLLPSNYRPIALMNVDAKVLTKLLTKRVAMVIEKLIPPEQFGFVPNRKITSCLHAIRDLIHIAQHNPDQLPDHPSIILVDQAKAYDRVNWLYLIRILKKLNFGPTFIKTIKTIYTDRFAKLIINRSTRNSFKISRGVLQGCPLSPFLFILQMIPLINKLKQKQHQFGLQLHPDTPPLIGTFFADDATLFTNSINHTESILNFIQHTYAAGSGAKLNADKTNIILLTNKPPPPLPQNISDLIVPPDSTTRILGIHFSFRPYLKQTWEKIRTKIYLRSRQLLHSCPTSKGKVIFTRSLLRSKLTYCLPILYLSPTETRQIETIEHAYINKYARTSDSDKTHKPHFIYKRWIQSPTKFGGLGLKPFHQSVNFFRLKHLSSFITEALHLPPHQLPPQWIPTWTTWVLCAQSLKLNPPDLLYIQPPPIRSTPAKPWKSLNPVWIQSIQLLHSFQFLPKHQPSTDPQTLLLNQPIFNNFYLNTHLPPTTIINPSKWKQLCNILQRKGFIYLHHLFSHLGLRHPYQLIQTLTPLQLHRFQIPILASTFHYLFNLILNNYLHPIPPTLRLTQSPPPSPMPVWVAQSHHEPIPIPLNPPSLSLWHKELSPIKQPIPKHNQLSQLTPQDLQKTFKYSAFLAKHTLPKYRDIFWRIQRNLLPVKRLLFWLPPPDQLCIHDCAQLETNQHLFWECPTAFNLWQYFLPLTTLFCSTPYQWRHVIQPNAIPFQHHLTPANISLIAKIWHILISILLHLLWINRCNTAFQEVPGQSPYELTLQHQEIFSTHIKHLYLHTPRSFKHKLKNLLQKWQTTVPHFQPALALIHNPPAPTPPPHPPPPP